MKTRNPMAEIVVNQPSSLQTVAEAINSRDNWKEKGWMPIVL